MTSHTPASETIQPLSDDVLQKAHSLQLYILKTIRDICKANGISFFLYFGTLLGAVRHHGFIPWDDDMDIGMTRENFDRFMQIAKEALPASMQLQFYSFDHAYGHLFAKVVLKGTIWELQYCEHIQAMQGVYVDIFPFDLVPSDPSLQRIHYKMAKSAVRMLRLRCGYELPVHNLYLRWRNKLIAWRSRHLPLHELHSKIQEVFEWGRAHADHNAPLCTAIGENYYGTMIPLKHLQSLVDFPFEDDAFPIPAQYDLILKSKYGDYMTPPPPDRRGGHSVLKFDFGIYGKLPPEKYPSGAAGLE